MARKPLIRTVLKAWLIVGTLDLTAASIQFYLRTGRGPAPVMKYIAGALFEKDSFQENVTVAIGVIMHYLIALAFTLFFFWITAKSSALLKNRLLTGLLYGAFIWVVMNLLLVPQTRIQQPAFSLNSVMISMAILIACIGLPLALWLRPKPAAYTR